MSLGVKLAIVLSSVWRGTLNHEVPVQGHSTLIPGRAESHMQRGREKQCSPRFREPRSAGSGILGRPTDSEIALAAFSSLLDILAESPDPQRPQGKRYKLGTAGNPFSDIGMFPRHA